MGKGPIGNINKSQIVKVKTTQKINNNPPNVHHLMPCGAIL
jgi:hypothetical protein